MNNQSNLLSQNKIIEYISNLYINENLNGQGNSLNVVLSEIEQRIIKKALMVSKGNQRKAALLLNIKYTTLNEKVKRWKLSKPIKMGG